MGSVQIFFLSDYKSSGTFFQPSDQRGPEDSLYESAGRGGADYQPGGNIPGDFE